MSETVIAIEGLCKKYKLGVIGHGTLTHDLQSWWAKMRGKPDPNRRLDAAVCNTGNGSNNSEFWANRDISFEVKRGEVVGLIGKNGAGKSTLLKIMSRVTLPTKGRVRARGRIASLLEVGTGFQKELTGRENIYLNGSILGMKRFEIDRKFPEIVQFSEIGEFIDTPVKRYSSGMYVRLAFSVAAHLEAEILLIDEVLAVGDYQFQKKCLGKMGDVTREGRTILFVSHNIGAIQNLCNRTLWIDNGKIVQDGDTSTVVRAYIDSHTACDSSKNWLPGSRPGNRDFQLISIILKDRLNRFTQQFNISEDIFVEIAFEVLHESAKPVFSLTLWDEGGQCIFSSLSNTEDNSMHGKSLPMGTKAVARCRIYGNLLNIGRYTLSLTGANTYWTDDFSVEHAVSFSTIEDGILKRDYPGGYGGLLRPKLNWEMTL